MRWLSSLPAVCIFVLTTPLLAQTDTCLSHAQESGSIFTGKVFDTYVELSGLDKETAMHRLEDQLPAVGFSIESVDAAAGTIKGIRHDPLLSHPFPVQFTVSPTATGVRVRLWLKTLPGQLPVGRFKHGICDMYKLLAVEPAPEPPTGATNASQEAVKPSSGEAASETKAEEQPAPAEDESEKPLSAEAITKLTSDKPSDDQNGDKESGNAHKKRQQKALTNEDIVSMVKAELGDKIVIDKIKASPGDKLDTSADALIRLKKAGVSKAVIDAMINRADE